MRKKPSLPSPNPSDQHPLIGKSVKVLRKFGEPESRLCTVVEVRGGMMLVTGWKKEPTWLSMARVVPGE